MKNALIAIVLAQGLGGFSESRSDIQRLIENGRRDRETADWFRSGAEIAQGVGQNRISIVLSGLSTWFQSSYLASRRQAISETLRAASIGDPSRWSPRFEPIGSGAAQTDLSGNVEVFEEAFEYDADFLAVVLFHEWVHFDDFAKGIRRNRLDNELRAYVLDIDFYERLHLQGPAREVSVAAVRWFADEGMIQMRLSGNAKADILDAWLVSVEPWLSRQGSRPPDFLPPETYAASASKAHYGTEGLESLRSLLLPEPVMQAHGAALQKTLLSAPQERGRLQGIEGRSVATPTNSDHGSPVDETPRATDASPRPSRARDQLNRGSLP